MQGGGSCPAQGAPSHCGPLVSWAPEPHTGAWGCGGLCTPFTVPVSLLLQLWKGRWQGNDIVIKMLKIRDWTTRKSRDFNEEYPKLR